MATWPHDHMAPWSHGLMVPYAWHLVEPSILADCPDLAVPEAGGQHLPAEASRASQSIHPLLH